MIRMFLFGLLAVMTFDYDLHLVTIPGKMDRTMICFHGYGANYEIGEFVQSQVEATVVSFNFPDHDILNRESDPKQLTFGTIEELLPAIYVMKKVVIDGGLDSVDLYGFSAGGGAVINAIAVLSASKHDAALAKIGVGSQEKKILLDAIRNGLVVLDAPLKSVEEIIDLRGKTEELEILARNYRENGLRPIDSVRELNGFHVVLYFDTQDEIIFNRDDSIFIDRLKKANSKGTTVILNANEGGHLGPHASLWEYVNSY